MIELNEMFSITKRYFPLSYKIIRHFCNRNRNNDNQQTPSGPCSVQRRAEVANYMIVGKYWFMMMMMEKESQDVDIL